MIGFVDGCLDRVIHRELFVCNLLELDACGVCIAAGASSGWVSRNGGDVFGRGRAAAAPSGTSASAPHSEVCLQGAGVVRCGDVLAPVVLLPQIHSLPQIGADAPPPPS